MNILCLTLLSSINVYFCVVPGNHGFYQFQGMGEGDDVSVSASTCQPSEEGAFEPVFFTPRGLENLALIDEVRCSLAYT